jgi:hypothetical protein
MTARFAFLLACLLANSATFAQRPNRAESKELLQRLSDDFRACDHPSMRLSPYRNYDPHRDLLRELRAMLGAPVDACPDTPGRAVAFLRGAIGDPVRPDADVSLLAMLEAALRSGTGGPPDLPSADALARHLWLVGAERGVPGLSAEALEAWAAGSEGVALLEARIAAAPTGRAIWVRAGQLLDRTRADYDPKRAADLLENSPDRHRDALRLRLSDLLSDGTHLPPDFKRAAALFRAQATGVSEPGFARRALLTVGRRAAAAARSPDERLAALAILAPAALDGGEAGAAYERELRRVSAPVVRTPIPRILFETIRSEMDFAFAYLLDMLPDETKPGSRPIGYEGLVGRDGRLVTVRLAQSSGVTERDEAVRAAWLRRGDEVDFSSVAGGRTAWIMLPPVDPMFDYSAAYDRVKARCPFCM